MNLMDALLALDRQASFSTNETLRIGSIFKSTNSLENPVLDGELFGPKETDCVHPVIFSAMAIQSEPHHESPSLVAGPASDLLVLRVSTLITQQRVIDNINWITIIVELNEALMALQHQLLLLIDAYTARVEGSL